MNDIGVIDQFTNVFGQYIDSGFGLLGGEVKWLAATLIAIDITLAGLFWALSAAGAEDVLDKASRGGSFSGHGVCLSESFSVSCRFDDRGHPNESGTGVGDPRAET